MPQHPEAFISVPAGTEVLFYTGQEHGWQPHKTPQDQKVNLDNVWQPNDEKFHDDDVMEEQDEAFLNFLKKSTANSYTALKLEVMGEKQWCLTSVQFRMMV